MGLVISLVFFDIFIIIFNNHKEGKDFLATVFLKFVILIKHDLVDCIKKEDI